MHVIAGLCGLNRNNKFKQPTAVPILLFLLKKKEKEKKTVCCLADLKNARGK